MKISIPSIGDKLKLCEPWDFTLFSEYKNMDLIRKLRPDATTDQRKENAIPVTLPAGTILTVSRIYIRKGKASWDSLTFTIAFEEEQIQTSKRKKKPKLVKYTFWAKLHDVNEMDAEHILKE